MSSKNSEQAIQSWQDAIAPQHKPPIYLLLRFTTRQELLTTPLQLLRAILLDAVRQSVRLVWYCRKVDERRVNGRWVGIDSGFYLEDAEAAVALLVGLIQVLPELDTVVDWVEDTWLRVRRQGFIAWSFEWDDERPNLCSAGYRGGVCRGCLHHWQPSWTRDAWYRQELIATRRWGS